MKNWVRRALRTFGQAAAGYFCASIVTVDWTADRAVIRAAITGIIVSSIAGGISAAMNIMDDRKDW